MSTQTKTFRTLTRRKAADTIILLSVTHQWGAPVNGLTLLWQLPWALFRTHSNCINKSFCFKGVLATLAICHPVSLSRTGGIWAGCREQGWRERRGGGAGLCTELGLVLEEATPVGAASLCRLLC